ncbi:PTS sugar transporter subunit IIC [Vagococcus sp. BWB3-3]|uniref:Permease IIC component n=1 Tax=Vagococcus allomyrinae TaxID=2794353 RepID=A0A940PGR3_9ENTE|nr:PTS transporter subunit EIIC [Vagococcus allomyrinae]MBP1042593.1 PTS sugar transporter subunit IIC [Vagococcus allomyrinae]
MSFHSIGEAVENKMMPLANKMGTQRHLSAIRDAFITLLPINLTGGVVAILKSPPITETTTNKFLLGWADWVASNELIFSWLYAFTLGAMSLYICMGVTHFLCKYYQLETFIPMMFATLGFMLVATVPVELGYAAKTLDFTYIDGKGIIPALLIAFLTSELYALMKRKNFGRIKMPDSVPASLSEVFASLVPGMVLIGLYGVIFIVFHKIGTPFPKFLFQLLTPALHAADSLPSVIFITVITHIFWFFGLHDAALSGIVGPLRDGNLSINATAQVAGETLPHIFTTPFYVYFIVIGGSGAVLGLAFFLLFAKSKQLKVLGRIGILPSFFGISEPLIFGIPLMLNPLFFIPFICAPTFNAIVAYVLTKIGLLDRTFSMLSWNMPSLIGGFFSTLDVKSIVIIVGLTVVNALMYYPFLKIYDRQLVAKENESIEKD